MLQIQSVSIVQQGEAHKDNAENIEREPKNNAKKDINTVRTEQNKIVLQATSHPPSTNNRH